MPNFVAPFIGVGVALKAPTADGTVNQVIETDGAGNLSFVDAGAGGSPGGSDTQFQYNNGGAFGGIGSVTFDDTNDYVVAGSHTYTAASGTDLPVSITPTYNQTSTAAATDLLINRTQTAVGSGNQRLIDLQVAGTSRFRVNNLGTATIVSSTTTATPLILDTPASFADGTAMFEIRENGTRILAMYGNSEGQLRIGEGNAGIRYTGGGNVNCFFGGSTFGELNESMFGPGTHETKDTHGNLSIYKNTQNHKYLSGQGGWALIGAQRNNNSAEAGISLIRGVKQQASNSTFTKGGDVQIQGGDGATAGRRGHVIIDNQTHTNGTTDDAACKIVSTLNDTASAGGSDVFRSLHIQQTHTDVTGWDNVYLADFHVGGATKFRVRHTGRVEVVDQASAPPAKDGSEAADDWLEITMGGTQFWIPLYNT